MKSIRGKLSVGLIAAAFVFALAAGSALYGMINNRLFEQVDERLRVLTLSITTGILQDEGYLSSPFSDRYLREFDDKNPTKFYQIWAPVPVGWRSWPTTQRSESLGGQSLPKRFGTIQEPEYWSLTLPNGKPGRAVGIQFNPGYEWHYRKKHDKDLKAVIVVAEDLTRHQQNMAVFRNSIGFVIIVGLVTTVFVIPPLLRLYTKPLQVVSKQAEAISAETLNTRFAEANLPLELRPICGRLNELMQRLETSFERERQFSSDIAHELRTPIAELKSYAEVQIKWPDPKGDQNFAQETLKIAEQMEGLVGALLTLAKCENGEILLESTDLELASLIQEIVLPQTDRARSKRLELVSDIKERIVIHSNPAFLQTIIGNVVSNAIEYSPAESTIAVRAKSQGPRFLLQISNRAPNLSEASAQKMFDRFWRAEPSRSSSSHSGLGLSLSKAIADQLGFKLSAAWTEGILTITLAGERAYDTPRKLRRVSDNERDSVAVPVNTD